MPINFAPHPGSIVRCDFRNLEESEMTKVRPVVVLSPREERNNKRTCIVVSLSTTPPSIIRPYHLQIALPGELPGGLKSRACWVKGDMIYSVSLKRIDFYRFSRGMDGKRNYYYDRINEETMKYIRKTIGYAIGHIS